MKSYYMGIYYKKVMANELYELLEGCTNINYRLQEYVILNNDNLDSSEGYRDFVKGWNQGFESKIEKDDNYFLLQVATEETCDEYPDGICDNFQIESMIDFSQESLELLRQELE